MQQMFRKFLLLSSVKVKMGTGPGVGKLPPEGLGYWGADLLASGGGGSTPAPSCENPTDIPFA